MKSHADGSVHIQTSAEAVPSTPSWFGEVVLIVEYLRKHGVLTRISEHMRFARKRFGHYVVIDFLAVQIALCHQRGAHAGGVLRATSALCRTFHGRGWSVTSCRPVQPSRVS